MDRETVEALIAAHASEEKRIRRLFDYYRGKHDILQRQQESPSKPNNRLCCGYPALIANAYAGYMFGEPVTYQAEGGLMESIEDAFRYNDEQAENAALGLDLAVCGVAVELHYVDGDARERFCRVDPAGCIDVREDTVEEALKALIRYYDVFDVEEGCTLRRVEVYEADSVTCYEVRGYEWVQTDRFDHPFGDVPAVFYRNNSSRMGDFEGVMTLIDAYDLMQSESLNDQEYFSDAYLMLRGLEGTNDEDIQRMKQNRVLLVPSDAGAEWLIKQQGDEGAEKVKTRLNNDIHRFSGCPDMTDESFAGNASGVALKYKLLQFENIASVKEREFKRGLQRRLELLCRIWALKGRGVFDWRDVGIRFTRALPENLLEISQTLVNLDGLLSPRTLRSMLPMEIDEEAERARLEEEGNRKGAEGRE